MEARSLFCYWAGRELGVSATELVGDLGDAACSEYFGQERRKPGQRKEIEALGQVDIYEFMGVPKYQ